MAPPVHPSPHRFLSTPRPRNVSPTPKRRQEPPKLAPRYTTQRQVETPQQTTASAVSSSQFASTPRFGLARPRPPAQSPPKASLASSLRPKRLGEDVEDNGDDYDDDAAGPYATNRAEGDEMLLDVEDGEVEVMQSIEHEGRVDLPFSPKRRRVDATEPPARAEARTDAVAMPPPSTPVRPPVGDAPEPSKAPTPRFVSAPTPSATAEAFRARPSFVNPSPATTEAAPPLPEAFSPHRRGNRFVPGGMAATVQQWVVETGQMAVQTRRGQGYLRGEEFILKFRVENLKNSNGGPWLLEGRDAERNLLRIALIGDRKGEGLEQGRIVGIRAPTWEVEIDGRCWTVGVDWRVIS